MTQNRKLGWMITLAIEMVLAWGTYQMCWIIKWPPQGPIRYFVGYPIWVAFFVVASLVFWALIAAFWSVVRVRERLTVLNLNR